MAIISVTGLNPDGFLMHMPDNPDGFSGTFYRSHWQLAYDTAFTDPVNPAVTGTYASTNRYFSFGAPDLEGSNPAGNWASAQFYYMDRIYYARVRLENSTNNLSDWSETATISPGAHPKLSTWSPDLSQPISGFDDWQFYGSEPAIGSPVIEDNLAKLFSGNMTGLWYYQTWLDGIYRDGRDTEVVFRINSFAFDSLTGVFAMAEFRPRLTAGTQANMTLSHSEDEWGTSMGTGTGTYQALPVSPATYPWWKFHTEVGGHTGKISYSADGENWILLRSKVYDPEGDYTQKGWSSCSYKVWFDLEVWDEESTSNHLHIGNINASLAGLEPPVLHTAIPLAPTRGWLEWIPGTNAEAHQVHRGTEPDFEWGVGTWLDTLGASASSYDDTGLQAETTYWYVIVATKGTDAEPSNYKSLTTPKGWQNPQSSLGWVPVPSVYYRKPLGPPLF
jgi:hypothetical protein